MFTRIVFFNSYPVSYLLIAVLVITAVLQIKYLNKALQRFDSTEVIPTQFVLFTVSAIIGSAVLYHDFDGMDMEQMSRFMSGCAIEFLGVYLITSKRTKRIYSPALSISADSGTAVSFSDEEALDRVDLLPSEQPLINRKSTPFNNNNNRSSHLPTTTFEAWQEANSHIANTLNNTQGQRRHSSVFRGISMASQLLDRNDEQQQGSIQLPISSPTHRRNDSSTISHILSGITSAISSHTNPTPHDHTTTIEEADAIEIEIPTPSSFLQESDRELMPIHPKRTSKLVTTSQQDRDLS